MHVHATSQAMPRIYSLIHSMENNFYFHYNIDQNHIVHVHVPDISATFLVQFLVLAVCVYLYGQCIHTQPQYPIMATVLITANMQAAVKDHCTSNPYGLDA